MGNNKKKKKTTRSTSRGGGGGGGGNKSAVGGGGGGVVQESVSTTTLCATDDDANTIDDGDLSMPKEEDVVVVSKKTPRGGEEEEKENDVRERASSDKEMGRKASGVGVSKGKACSSRDGDETRSDDAVAEQRMIRILKKVQAVVRGWKTRAKLSAELAKASIELGGAWELFELAPSEKVTKGPIKCKALSPKTSGMGEMYVTTSYVCFDAEKEKEEEGLLNALLPAAVGNGMQTQPLRLKIPLFDLESVAPKVTNVGFMQNRTSLIMLFKDKAFKPKEFVDVDDIESVVETINLQLRQRANDISNARLLASMAEVALRDRNIRNGKAARDLSDSKFYQVAHLANDKMRDDVNVLMDARARYSDENINSNVVMVKNNEGEDVALNEDEIKLLPNAISQMKVKHANEVAELRREHSQRTLELSDRYAKKIKELEARIHASEEAAHNEREDRNKIVKGLNEQVHKLKDFVKSADSEASLNVKKLDDRLATTIAENEKLKWFLEKAEQSKIAAEKSLEVERENYSKHKGEFTSGEAKLTMSLEEKSKALEEMKKMHEQIKEHLHSEGLEKATQLTEAKHAIVLLQKETAKYEKEMEELTKENTKNKELLDNSRELQKDAMMNIEKLTKDSTEAKETSEKKIASLTRKIEEMHADTKVVVQDHVDLVEEDIFRNVNFVVMEEKLKLANEDLQRLTFELLRARQSEGNERVGIAAQALQQRLEIAEERAQVAEENASRLESKRVVAEQMVASMKNAMQDAQNKEKEEEEEEAIGASTSSALAVLSGIHSREYSPKHASTRFDPNKHEMFRAGAASTPVSKMSRLDQITPAPAMSATSNFTTPAGKSAKYASPMVDAPMSSIMKSKSGNAIAHERSGNLSPAASGAMSPPVIVERIVEKIVEVPVYKDVPTVVEKVVEKIVEKKVPTGITESDLKRAKELGKAELKSEIGKLEKLKQETAPIEVEVEKLVEVYLTKDEVKKKNEELKTKIENLEKSIETERKQKNESTRAVKELEKEVKSVRKKLESKKPIEKIVELEYFVEVPTGISKETLEKHEKKILAKADKDVESRKKVLEMETSQIQKDLKASTDKAIKEAKKKVEEAEKKVIDSEKATTAALEVERKALAKKEKSLDNESKKIKKRIDEGTVEAKKAFEEAEKEARSLLAEEIKRYKNKEAELMKKTKSMAKDIESAKMGGFKEAEKTYKQEIDRLKKIELNLDDEIKRTRAELNKEHVKRLAEIEREKKQSETKYIAEIAQLRASAVAPTIVAAATREEEKTVSSPTPPASNVSLSPKGSSNDGNNTHTITKTEMEEMVKYVEVPDKQSELRYEAELARITKEHKAKLKDANDKIEALKKSHQAELEKVESDFENEIQALKSLDQEASMAREQGQRDATKMFERDMRDLRKSAENEKKQLEKTISRLESDITNLNRKAKNELEDLRRSLERKNDKISQELARAKNAREREVYDTKIKLEQAEQKTQELEKKIQSMREQIASPHEQVKQIERQERERAKLFTEKVKLEAKVKSLEEKVSLQKVELNETIANSPAKVSSREMQKLKDESVAARADHKAAKEELSRIQSENARLSREIAMLEVEKEKSLKPTVDPKISEELSKTKDQYAKSLEERAVLETKLSFLERDAPAAKKEVLSLEAEKKKLEARITALEAVERELLSRAKNAELGKSKLEKTLDEMEKIKKVNDVTRMNLEKENSLLAQTRDQLQKEVSTSESKLSKLIETNSENEKNLGAQTARLSEIEKQRALLDQRVEQLEKEKAAFENELEESKELGYALQNSQNRLQTVEQTLKETKSTWKDLEAKYEIARDELKKVERSEATLKQALMTLEKEHAELESKSKRMSEELSRNEGKLKRLHEAETKIAVEAEKHKLNEEKFKQLEERTAQMEKRAEILAEKERELVGVKEKLVAHEAQKKMFEKEVKQAQEKQSMLESTIEMRRGEYQAVISKMSEAEREVVNAKVAAAMAKEYASNSRDTLEKVQEREMQMREELTQIRIAYEALTVEYREKAFEYATNAARLEKIIADLQRQVALLEQKAESLVDKNHEQDLEKQKLLNHIKNQEYDMEQLRKESLGYYNAYVQVNEQLKRTKEMLEKEVRDSQNLHNAIAMGKQSVTDSFGQIGYGGYGQQQQHQQSKRLNLAPPPAAISSFSPDKPHGSRFSLLPPPDDIKDMIEGNSN